MSKVSCPRTQHENNDVDLTVWMFIYFCGPTYFVKSHNNSVEPKSEKLYLLLNCTFAFCSALDAYCLLEVYDVLKQWVVESRLRINMEPAVILSWLQPKKEKPRYDVTMVTF